MSAHLPLATRILQLATIVCCLVLIIITIPSPTDGRRLSSLSASKLLAALECGRFEFPKSRRSLDESENGTQSSGDRIAGGFDAKAGWFPSYVFLDIVVSSESKISRKYCGGTLINEHYVLTAAHCVDTTRSDIKPDNVEIYTGFISMRDYDAKYQADIICITMDNVADESLPYLDMALLRTSRKIRFNKRVQPACLPQAPFDTTQRVYTVGMGRISNAKNPELPESLQFLEMGISKCPPRYKEFKPNPFTICFVAPKGTPCRGDSGGPVFAIVDGRQTVFGITAWGPDDCSKAPILGAFTDVHKAVAQLYESASKCASSTRRRYSDWWPHSRDRWSSPL